MILTGIVLSGENNFSYCLSKLEPYYTAKTGMRLFPGTLNVHLPPDDVMVVGPFTVDNLITGFGPPNSIRCGLSQVRAASLHCEARHMTGECLEVSTLTPDW